MPSKSWASSALPAGRGAQQPRFQCTVAVLGDAIPEHPQAHSKEVGNPSSPPRPASARISSPSPGQKQERPRSPRAGTCVPGRIPTGPSCGGIYGSQNPTPWTAHSDACSLTTTPLPGPAQAPSWVCRWALGEQLLVEALCREPRQPATSPKLRLVNSNSEVCSYQEGVSNCWLTCGRICTQWRGLSLWALSGPRPAGRWSNPSCGRRGSS